MLELGTCDLHAPGASDRRMRNIPVSGDLVAGVDHDDATLQVIGEDPGDFSQGRGLADPWATHEEQGLTTVQQIADHGDRSVHRPSDATGESDHVSGAVADGTDAVESSLDAGPVVTTEGPQPLQHGGQIGPGDRCPPELHDAPWITGLGDAAEIEDNLEQLFPERR
jgi:hypothetical protein